MDGRNQAESIQMKSPQQIQHNLVLCPHQTQCSSSRQASRDQSDVDSYMDGNSNPDRRVCVCVNDVAVL